MHILRFCLQQASWKRHLKEMQDLRLFTWHVWLEVLMWQSISSTTQLIYIEARTKEATKKKLMICGILWSLVVTSWHVDMTPREERSWLVPAGPGVGNPHARDAGAEGLKGWGRWDWEDLKSFFTKNKQQYARRRFFFSAVKFHQV